MSIPMLGYLSNVLHRNPGVEAKPARKWRRNRLACGVLLFGSIGMSSGVFGQTTAAVGSLSEAETIVAKASSCGGQERVESGVPAQPGKSIAFVAEDLSNAGIVAVAVGVSEAAKAMGWKLKIFDVGGNIGERNRVMNEVMAFNPDGVILGGRLLMIGSEMKEDKLYDLTPFANRGIALVGWHATSVPGPIAGTPVAVNITTDPLEVARLAALKAIAESDGRANVVIFTDSTINIAMTKANAMAEIIRSCKGCSLLEFMDVRLKEVGTKMPGITKELLSRYGDRWTHALAINDIYFDYAIPSLTASGLPNNKLSLISAGDGSPSAFLRIAAKAFQTATVAEPLNLQGWQLVDELNRLFARQPVSTFVAQPRLVTSSNLTCDGGQRRLYDPDNGYRVAYQRIWKR